jgi:hypothetical protein
MLRHERPPKKGNGTPILSIEQHHFPAEMGQLVQGVSLASLARM